MLAAACGGGSEGAVQDGAEDASESGDPGLSIDPPDGAATDSATGEEVELGTVGRDESGEIDLEDVPEADPSLFVVDGEEDDGPVDPWKVFVLTAKSDTGIVPVFSEPGGESFTLEYEYVDGERIAYPLSNPTHFGNPLALTVTQGKPGDNWAEVMVPTRPNGTAAWVQTAFFEWSSHNYHVEIDVGTNDVRVWKGDELIGESPAVTGRSEAATPVLRTFIDEKIPGPNDAYGTWIISLGAFSEQLNLFNGGLPKLAVHGTNRPDLVESREYASAGCIRVPNEFVEMIADMVPVGATVDIINSSSA